MFNVDVALIGVVALFAFHALWFLPSFIAVPEPGAEALPPSLTFARS